MKRDPRTIMIVGATSAIAQGAAAAFASEGASFFLVGRSPERLGTVAADLSARGAVRVEVLAVDPADVKGHEHAIAAGFAAFGSFDGLLIAHGTLPEQAACERDPSLAVDSLSVNATSVISFLLHIAPKFEAQRHGSIAVIGSVAGDRGRRSNHVYGAAKAALDVFLQGFRGRMTMSGVRVLTVKPGFVDSPMTEHLRKNPLYADAGAVGRRIHDAMVGGRQGVLYVPWFWAPIMFVIRALPEAVLRRLPL